MTVSTDFEDRIVKRLGAMQRETNQRFDTLHGQQAQMLEVLQGEMRAGSERAKGLMQRTDDLETEQDAQSAKIADLIAAVTELRAAVDGIKATPGKLALGWLSKLILAITVPAAVWMAAVAVQQLAHQAPKGGPHP